MSHRSPRCGPATNPAPDTIRRPPQIIITREFDAPRDLVFRAQHGFHGEPSPEAIVHTFEYEGAPGQLTGGR